MSSWQPALGAPLLQQSPCPGHPAAPRVPPQRLGKPAESHSYGDIRAPFASPCNKGRRILRSMLESPIYGIPHTDLRIDVAILRLWSRRSFQMLVELSTFLQIQRFFCLSSLDDPAAPLCLTILKAQLCQVESRSTIGKSVESQSSHAPWNASARPILHVNLTRATNRPEERALTVALKDLKLRPRTAQGSKSMNR